MLPNGISYFSHHLIQLCASNVYPVELIARRIKHISSILHIQKSVAVLFVDKNPNTDIYSAENLPQAMEMRTPEQNDTMVGRVEIPRVLFNSTPNQSLAGTLTGAQPAQANSARRRLHGPTLLQSPPRRGHSSRMGDIFSNAKASMSMPSIRVTSPIQGGIRQPPLRLRPASATNKEWPQGDTLAQTVGRDILYPALPQEGDLPVPKPGTGLPTSIPGLENGRQPYQTTRFYPQLQGGPNHHPAPRLSPTPGTPQHSYFNNPPKIACAQIVAMKEIDTMQNQEELSSSSASWTGDSQFYIPQHKAMVLPAQERKSSVPEWLENLPVEPDQYEREGPNDEKVVPLSPHVEVERGSMRKKMRKQDGRRRCLSVTDEDIYFTCHEQY